MLLQGWPLITTFMQRIWEVPPLRALIRGLDSNASSSKGSSKGACASRCAVHQPAVLCCPLLCDTTTPGRPPDRCPQGLSEAHALQHLRQLAIELRNHGGLHWGHERVGAWRVGAGGGRRGGV
jgi:hypothetical protein